MSYIRSTNNPESLYIWGDEEKTHVYKGPDYIGSLPNEVMEGLIKKYSDEFHPDECEYKGAKIEEVWVLKNDVNNFKTSDEWCKETSEMIENKDPEFMNKVGARIIQTRFSYENWHVDMWDVTWHYIVTIHNL